jgi:iron complex transport system ATP-binding protein
MILANDLACGYDHHSVVSGINFALDHGRTMVLLGPNGVGKSTLLKTIAGLRRPIQGSVKVEGHELHTLAIKERAKLIAWVPQSEKLEFGWRVDEFVGIGRTTRTQGLRNSKHDNEVIESSLEKVGCQTLRHRSVLELSGGELQRVRIARGLAQEASILMLDEPTAHLDIQHQVEVLHLLQQLMSDGATIAISLHDLNQATALNAEYLLLHDQRGTHFSDRNELRKTNLLDGVYQNSIEQIVRSDGSVALLPTYTTDCL